MPSGCDEVPAFRVFFQPEDKPYEGFRRRARRRSSGMMVVKAGQFARAAYDLHLVPT